MLAELAGQAVDRSASPVGAQRGDHQRLRLAAVNSAEPCGARQHAVADLDRADGAGVAAVDARLAGEDLTAHDARLRCRTAGVSTLTLSNSMPSSASVPDHGGDGLTAGLRCAPAWSGSGRPRPAWTASVLILAIGLVLGRRGQSRPACQRRRTSLVDGVDRDVACSWPNTAAQHHLFGQLLGADSTISTAASVPATTRNHLQSSSCVRPGSARTGRRRSRRAAPIGPLNGMPEIASAALAPISVGGCRPSCRGSATARG